MLSLEFTINIFAFALVILVVALAGFSLRSRQIIKNLSKIEQLERELLNSYSQILDLERENTSLENKLQDIKIPVIAMKTTIRDEQELSQKIPDITLRKKLLSKENLQRQIATGK